MAVSFLKMWRMIFDECDRMKAWKIFSLLLVVGVVSIVACAMISDDSSAEVRSGITGDCTWTLDGTILTISGNGAIADYDYYSKPSHGEDQSRKLLLKMV